MSPNQKLPFEIPSKAPEKWSRGEVIPFVKSGMVVELSTIPLYLYALYSIKPESEPGIQPGIQARTALRGVVQQEMLHLALTGNLLSALNGSMDLYDYNIIPQFPDTILFEKVPMTLAPANKQSLEYFLQIEGADNPRPPPDNKEPGLLPDVGDFKLKAVLGELDTYLSIGDFYADLEKGDLTNTLRTHSVGTYAMFLAGLRALPDCELSHNPDKQFSGMDFFGDQMVVISDQRTALDAINIVIEQGEGSHLVVNSHYTVFTDLYLNRKSWELYDVPTDPKTKDYIAGPYVYKLSLAFDAGYCYLLQSIQRIWNTGRKNHEILLHVLLLRNMHAIMVNVLSPLAGVLLKQQFGKGNAAPCFNYYPMKDDGTPENPLSPISLHLKLVEEVDAAYNLAAAPEEKDLLKKMSTYIQSNLMPNPT